MAECMGLLVNSVSLRVQKMGGSVFD